MIRDALKSKLPYSPASSVRGVSPKPNRLTEISSTQISEWDALMDGIDKQQTHLLNDQWTLLRTQLGSLMKAMAEMTSNESSLRDRITYLEEFIGESAEKHRKMEETIGDAAIQNESIVGQHHDMKATMEARLEYLEGLIGDSANKHTDEIAEAMRKMKDVHAAVASCAKAEHHASLEKRLEFLEKDFGESADKHDQHRTSMEERMEFVEAKLGDSAEKHWKEIEALKKKHGDLHTAVSQCAKQEHHTSLDERVKFVEKAIGESADKHDQHKTSMETRMEFLEAKIGDSADKHWKEIETLKGKHLDLHQAVQKCAQQENHTSLEKRMQFVEKELGESADKHDHHKTTVEERMEFLEAKLGDSAEKHAKEIEALKTKHGDMHKAVKECAKMDHACSLEKRLDLIEGAVGDNADKHTMAAEKHAKEIELLKGKHGDLHSALSNCAKKEHHSTLEERLRFVEKEIGESADKHDAHKTSMEDRMEFLENKVGDSAEKHWKEIAALKDKHSDLHKVVGQCAKQEHHSSLEDRMKFVEKAIGESADKHDQHKTTMEDRLEFIEKKLGDSAEKHWKEIESLKKNHGDMQKNVSQCAKQEHHSSLEDRMKFVEKAIGESADKHDEHKTTMEDRMEFLEAKIGDSADKHWKEIEALKKKHVDIHSAVSKCAQQDNHSSLEKRMQFVEKEIGESADKHDNHKTSVEQRMEFLEAKIGDSAEKHWKEIEAAKTKLGDVHKAVKECAKSDHASSLDKRLGFLEKCVGDNADNHTKALQDHKNGLQEHKESMETRLEYLEALLGDSADKHWKEIDAAKKKLGSIEAAVTKCAKVEHHATMEARVAEIEKDLGIHVNNHTTHKNASEGRLDTAERKLKELGISLDGKGHKSEIEKLEAVILTGIDKRLTTVEEKHLKDFIKRLNDYEKKHMTDFDQMRSKIGDIDKALKECANIEHYLGLDRKHGALSQQQAEMAEIFKENLQDVDGKIDAHRVNLDNVQKFLETKLRQVEEKLGVGHRVNEFMKDMEQRYAYMEQDQKRARDLLESSLQEQIRLEHSAVHAQTSQIKDNWDREVKARQAYQENYKELLQQERSARETTESHLGHRFENFERSIYSELQRVWAELGKEQQPIVIQQPPPTVTREVVTMPPVMAPKVVEEIIMPPVVQPTTVVEEIITPGVVRRPSVVEEIIMPGTTTTPTVVEDIVIPGVGGRPTVVEEIVMPGTTVMPSASRVAPAGYRPASLTVPMTQAVGYSTATPLVGGLTGTLRSVQAPAVGGYRLA